MTKPRAPRRPRLLAAGSEQEGAATVPDGEPTKPGGKGGQESEGCVVPLKPGNPDPRGPGGGKAAPGAGSVGGNDDGEIGLRGHLPET